MRLLLVLGIAGSACRLGFDAPRTGGGDDVVDDAAASVDGVLPIECEPNACGAATGTCIAGTCVIAATSESFVMCPASMPCRIECTGAGRPCRDGASCGAASSCELVCRGYRACQNGASCGSAPSCTVTCDGDEACESGISTAAGTTCVSHCCGLQACNGGVGTCATDGVCL